MSWILPHKIEKIESAFVVACEGFGDVCLVDKLLDNQRILNCTVGCPSRTGTGGDGKDFLKQYLAGISAVTSKTPTSPLKGLLVMLDADENIDSAFKLGTEALLYAGFEAPEMPYIPKMVNGFKTGVYLIPGEKETGTLEHLLLRSVFSAKPALEPCVDEYLKCVGKRPIDDSNTVAKMRMSALIGAAFQNNPWATPGMLLQSRFNDLVPTSSHHFSHLTKFLGEFCG